MSRYVAPALVLLAVVISLVAPWSIVETQQGTQEFTLKGMMDRDAVDMIWVWISGIGALLVIASAFLRGTTRKRLAQIGSILAVILPIKVLWDGFTREDTPGVTISPGWGLWLALILTVLAIIAALMMSDDDDVDSNVVGAPGTVDDTDTVVRTPRPVDDTDTVIRTERDPK